MMLKPAQPVVYTEPMSPGTPAPSRRSRTGLSRWCGRHTFAIATALLCCVAGAGGAAAVAPPLNPVVRPLLEAGTLTPRAGQAVQLDLHLPGGEGWGSAHVARCIARSGDRQWSVVRAGAEPPGRVSVTFDEPGPAIVVLSAGPASAKGRSDSWQRTPYCAKAIFTVQAPSPAPAIEPGGGVTAKTGQKIEILPMAEPAALRPGGHLPIRLYFEGQKVEGAQVRAFRSAGGAAYQPAPLAKPADAAGMTSQYIDGPGRWLLRFEQASGGVIYTADLVFEVSRP